MDYAEARVLLDRLPRFEVKPGLERTDRLLSFLERPERQYPAIHVAGTNGKGSVVAILDAILRESGYCVGRFTSPEVLDFRDRIAIDGAWLSEGEWAEGVDRLEPALKPATDLPAQFEAITALALDAFARKDVDIAVVEVGLGGRFDATNLVEPTVTILTNVSLDHTAILGDSIEKIAWEKAGIAKPGVPWVVGALPPQAAPIVQAEARKVGAPVVSSQEMEVSVADGASPGLVLLRGTGFPETVEFALPGVYQRENLRIALRAVQLLRERGFTISADAIEEGLRTVRWPGRLEVVRRSPDVVLDGAHNVAGARALAEEIVRWVPDAARRHLVFGVLADKDVDGILGALFPHFASVALTRSTSPRAMPTSRLAERLDGLSVPFACYDSLVEALTASLASASEDEVWVVAGSLTVVAEARQYLEGDR